MAKAVLDLHGCKATWVESIPIKELFEGEIAWEGVVQVFDIHYHPKATRRYAWSHGLDNSRRRRFFAVLHQAAINSPQAAVRAAIISGFRKKK